MSNKMNFSKLVLLIWACICFRKLQLFLAMNGFTIHVFVTGLHMNQTSQRKLHFSWTILLHSSSWNNWRLWTWKLKFCIKSTKITVTIMSKRGFQAGACTSFAGEQMSLRKLKPWNTIWALTVPQPWHLQPWFFILARERCWSQAHKAAILGFCVDHWLQDSVKSHQLQLTMCCLPLAGLSSCPCPFEGQLINNAEMKIVYNQEVFHFPTSPEATVCNGRLQQNNITCLAGCTCLQDTRPGALHAFPKDTFLNQGAH